MTDLSSMKPRPETRPLWRRLWQGLDSTAAIHLIAASGTIFAGAILLILINR